MERFISVRSGLTLIFSRVKLQGDVGENGVRTGLGHLEIPNGSTYDGSFQKVSPIKS